MIIRLFVMEKGTRQTYLWDGGVVVLLEEDSQEAQYYLKDELGSPIRLIYRLSV